MNARLASIGRRFFFPLFVAAVWVIVVAGAGRGFDFTDEGSYYLTALHPTEIQDRHTVYFYFGRVLFDATGQQIFSLRCLLAALLLGATLLFLRGVQAFTKTFAPGLVLDSWPGIAGVAGAAAAFSTAPVAPSYNLLNAMALLASSGLILQAAAAPLSPGIIPKRAVLVPLLGAALLLAADFLIKFSTSAVLAVTLSLLFFSASKESAKSKILLCCCCGLFICLLAAGYFLFVESYSVWEAGIAGTLRALRGTYLDRELARYASELRVQMTECLWAYEDAATGVLIGGGLLLLLRRRPVWQRHVAATGLIALGFILARIAADTGVLQHTGRLGVQFHLGMITTVGLTALVTFVARRREACTPLGAEAWKLVFLIPLLAVLPLAGAFGTTNDISANAVYQLAPWLVLLALLLAIVAQSWQISWLTGAAVIAISTVTFVQFFEGYWLRPYRLATGRQEQTVATRIGHPFSTLKLDPSSHAFVDTAREQLTSAGFQPGDDIFAFFNLPGLVFAMGGVSPGYPWYFAGDRDSLVMGGVRVRLVPPVRRARAFIITNGNIREFLTELKNSGIDFPAAYLRCGEPLKNPLTGEVVEIWCPKARVAP